MPPRQIHENLHFTSVTASKTDQALSSQAIPYRFDLGHFCEHFLPGNICVMLPDSSDWFLTLANYFFFFK